MDSLADPESMRLLTTGLDTDLDDDLEEAFLEESMMNLHLRHDHLHAPE